MAIFDVFPLPEAWVRASIETFAISINIAWLASSDSGKRWLLTLSPFIAVV